MDDRPTKAHMDETTRSALRRPLRIAGIVVVLLLIGYFAFSWVGGSNAVDNPVVRVERADGNGGWTAFADQQGEVQSFLQLPSGFQSVLTQRAGQQ